MGDVCKVGSKTVPCPKPATTQDQDLLYSMKLDDSGSRFEAVKEQFQNLSPAEAKQMQARLKANNSKDQVSKEFKAKFKGTEGDELKDVLTARYNPKALLPPAPKQPARKAGAAEAGSKKSDLNISGSVQQAKIQNQLAKSSPEIVKSLVDSKQPVSKPGEQLSWKEKQAVDGYLSAAKPEEFKKILSESQNWSLDAQKNLYSVIGDNDKLAERITKEFKGDALLDMTNKTLQFYEGKNNFRAAIINKADLSEIPAFINKAHFGAEVMRHRRGAEIIDSLDNRTKENAMSSLLGEMRMHGRKSYIEPYNFKKALNSLPEKERDVYLGNAANRGLLEPKVVQALDTRREEEMIRQTQERVRKQMENMR